MALYKSPVVGTNKVRLGASTCVSTLPSELVGILLENAAMLGPDYIVDRQEVSDIGEDAGSFMRTLREAVDEADEGIKVVADRGGRCLVR